MDEQVLRLRAPLAAQDDPAVAEEIRLGNRLQQGHVVIEVDELLGESRDPPQHADDRAAVEGRQVLLETREDRAMVDDRYARFPRRAGEARDERRDLSIGDDVDAPEPRREAQDRGDAVVDLARVVEARAVRGARWWSAAFGEERGEAFAMSRVGTVDPGDDGVGAHGCACSHARRPTAMLLPAGVPACARARRPGRSITRSSPAGRRRGPWHRLPCSRKPG